MRICNKCKIEKDISDFGKSSIKLDGISTICKKCNNYRSRKYNSENRSKKKESALKYYYKNKDVVDSNSKKWRLSNKEYFIEYQSKYRKERVKYDIVYVLSQKVRKLISNSFLRNKFSKNIKTSEILGCSFEEFKLHLESKFENWMSWENRGIYNGDFNYGWDIDHIVPISSAKSEDDIIKLNHFTNLRPLCSKINRDIKKSTLFYFNI